MAVSNSLKRVFCFISLEFLCSFDCRNSLLGCSTRADLTPVSPIQSSYIGRNLLRLKGAGIESQPARKDAHNEDNNYVDNLKACDIY